MLNGLAGKTAVLTGAGSGFGWECMCIAAKAGMQLVLVDVQADALAASAERARSLGAAHVMACKVDVGNAQAMEALAAEVKDSFGAPHFVFNNAGVGGSGGLLWEQSVRDWEWVLNVNLWGVIHGVRVFTPMMLDAAAQDPTWQGHIVNTASMAGLLAPPNMGVYNVSKHAVVSLTETLYQDLRLVTDQLHCSVLCPYFVPTGIANSERNRHDVVDVSQLTASQKIARAMTQKAVSSGKVSAQDIASKVFAAMADNQFYIFSHPHALGNVRVRMEDILELQNPRDAFSDRPEVGAQLRAALRGTLAA
ncbi:SDR family oxidoreductase [Comamonas sp. NoAH]|uniref:SDR family oxidoreductase n=1 Tax=Comamonas halotolerans TaxID=3041496 RepID=UPI0024E0E713|nr:SDR family oxidoreductase [Comamonas sp. NoAH]